MKVSESQWLNLVVSPPEKEIFSSLLIWAHDEDREELFWFSLVWPDGSRGQAVRGFPGLLGSNWAYFPTIVDSKLPRVLWCFRAQIVPIGKKEKGAQAAVSWSFRWIHRDYPLCVVQSTPRAGAEVLWAPDGCPEFILQAVWQNSNKFIIIFLFFFQFVYVFTYFSPWKMRSKRWRSKYSATARAM